MVSVSILILSGMQALAFVALKLRSMIMSESTLLDPNESLAWLDEGIREANVPTLLMMLCHLTGDFERWLSDRYRCKRIPGIDDFNSGGLSLDAQ